MSFLLSMSRWVEQIQSEGRYTSNRSEAEARTGLSFVAVQSGLRRLKQQGRIASPRRGFYVIVPPEYRAVGSPPVGWFIDQLMGHLGQPYYVGLLTAAAAHGAAHQQPMVFQVVTSKPMRAMRAGRVRIEPFMSGKVEQMPVVRAQTETGTMRVATAEVTAFGSPQRHSATRVSMVVLPTHLRPTRTTLMKASRSGASQRLRCRFSHRRPDRTCGKMKRTP